MPSSPAPQALLRLADKLNCHRWQHDSDRCLALTVAESLRKLAAPEPSQAAEHAQALLKTFVKRDERALLLQPRERA